MRKHLSLFAAAVLVASVGPGFSQKLIPNTLVSGVCYAGNKTTRIYIPPPGQFFRKSLGKGGASITVLYSGFPAGTKAAVGYAAAILESLLPSGTRITISASWEKITTAGVLANSSITGYTGGWTIDAQNPYTYYPVALAEKISGKSLNDSLSADITLRVNNSINWYAGTDGNTPRLQYDLVTIVLHEVIHGLGFFDSMDTDTGTGWYGIGPVPLIYDSFVENFQGQRLTDTLAFKNHSNALLRELTGGNIWFNGALLRAYTSGSRARLYAPPVWNSGSSISHLDENATVAPNTLMTPFIDMGEAIHDPGKLTLSILGDLGWINTRIIHNPMHDTERHITQLPLSVHIASDTLYDHSNIGAVFSPDNFASRDTIIMTSPGNNDDYSCTIAVPAYDRGIQYYFYAVDGFGRIYRSPSLTDSLRYSVFIGTDTTRPVITHTPLTSFLEKIDTIRFNAIITDNLGVDTAYAEYMLNDGSSFYAGMKPGRDNSWSAAVPAGPLLLKGGDSVQYRIVAFDSAAVPNGSTKPEAGYYTIHIDGLSQVAESYSTDFTGEAGADFISKGFTVYRPDGFSSFGLNSPHPYESPGDNDKTIEYTSILRHPLKLNESGLLVSFKEVVLVEPGDPGSLYGSDSFYDYVVVEGSKNWGKSWFSLADGYDSRLFAPWETAYNSSTDGMNSLATGSDQLLHSHSILFSPSGNAAAGDTLLLRFRLFSDPFANGWGWIIEDLNIRPFVTSAEQLDSGSDIKIYPNPGRGEIRLTTGQDDPGNGKPIRYSIYGSSGVSIESGTLRGGTENVINISGQPAGIYIIVLNRDDWIKTIRYSLIK